MITILGLRKSFGRLDVLRGIDLAIDRGIVTAVVGHNGSGKTTLIKTILGLVRPDSGIVQFDGRVVNGEATYRNQVGYMPQAVRFPDNLTALDLFKMLEDLRGRSAANRERLIERFRLGPELSKPLRTLSGGTRQKVSAVTAFMFQPELLILDEPTAGLDPVSSSILKDMIEEERRQGRTILLTSHIMSEIEELSDRVVFLQDGRIRYEGNVATLRIATGEANLERAIAQMMEEAA